MGTNWGPPSPTAYCVCQSVVSNFNVFKSEDHTLFLAVHIMDMYLYKNTSVMKSDDIHLLGLTCIFIASKFEDIIPIRMDSIVNKIGHKTFPAYNEFN